MIIQNIEYGVKIEFYLSQEGAFALGTRLCGLVWEVWGKLMEESHCVAYAMHLIITKM